ncbi:MAG: hypothetical protein ACFFG0_08440 [Candidatus Thorarchaeota archaeon]
MTKRINPPVIGARKRPTSVIEENDDIYLSFFLDTIKIPGMLTLH